jgi:hypothetical protein
MTWTTKENDALISQRIEKMICLNKTRLTQHFGTVFQMIWRNRVTLVLLVSSAATNGNHLSGLIWRQLIIIQKQERHQNLVNITLS